MIGLYSLCCIVLSMSRLRSWHSFQNHEPSLLSTFCWLVVLEWVFSSPEFLSKFLWQLRLDQFDSIGLNSQTTAANHFCRASSSQAGFIWQHLCCSNNRKSIKQFKFFVFGYFLNIWWEIFKKLIALNIFLVQNTIVEYMSPLSFHKYHKPDVRQLYRIYKNLDALFLIRILLLFLFCCFQWKNWPWRNRICPRTPIASYFNGKNFLLNDVDRRFRPERKSQGKKIWNLKRTAIGKIGHPLYKMVCNPLPTIFPTNCLKKMKKIVLSKMEFWRFCN